MGQLSLHCRSITLTGLNYNNTESHLIVNCSPKEIGFWSLGYYDAVNIGNTVHHRFTGSDQEILIGVY